jgi:hypothetical protein
MTSSPRAQWLIRAARLLWVPEGKNRPAALPARAAVMASRALTVGSSPQTSSPTGARVIAASMAGEGRVTVSLRRSTKPSAEEGPADTE